jgi:mono/diheme cytochrome c family protein
LVIFYACSPKISQPEAPKIPETQFAEGKMLYKNNCSKCHKLYDAKSFSKEQWTPIMLKMQKKAKISDE